MKKVCLLILMQCLGFHLYCLNITIIESQSSNNAHYMDQNWKQVVTDMGHNPTISPQSTLDNSSFFSGSDILIISSGIIGLSSTAVKTIISFLKTGKSVYLQSEYLPTYATNIAFADIVTSLGGSFKWNTKFSGDLQPMKVLGKYGSTNNTVKSLGYYWYSVSGSGDCNVINFLEYGSEYHGFQYTPVNSSYGSISTTTDQDWVRSLTSTDLMENIITHLISPPQGSSSISINLGNDTILCPGETIKFNASTTNANYLWQDNSKNSTFTVTKPGKYWVRVTLNNCSAIDTIHVKYSLPSVNLGNDTSLCAGESLILDATYQSAQYSWQDNSNNSKYVVTTAGTYWVKVSLNNCFSADTIQVKFDPLPKVNLGRDTVLCEGETFILDVAQMNGTYQWHDNSKKTDFTITNPGLYWVKVTINNCIKADTIRVIYNPLPAFDLGMDTTLCEGQTLIVDATCPNAGYEWQNGSNNPTYSLSKPGIYRVKVTSNKCSRADSIRVMYAPSPTVNLGNDTSLCQGEILLLDVSAQNTVYRWQDNSSGPTYTVNRPGSYWVKISLNNCHQTDTIHITYDAAPIIDLGRDESLCPGETLKLNARTPNATYQWQDNSTNSNYTVQGGGIFWVKVTNHCGTDSDTIMVYINNCNVHIPNAFSPNGDKINEDFGPVLINGTLVKLEIFNPWGEKLYEGTENWDGQYGDQPCIQGVYAYLATISSLNFGSIVISKHSGQVILLR